MLTTVTLPLILVGVVSFELLMLGVAPLVVIVVVIVVVVALNELLRLEVDVDEASVVLCGGGAGACFFGLARGLACSFEL